MATSRWEGSVHFWDYSPESPELYPGVDAYRTGDAFIYNPNGFANGIVTVLPSADELNGVTLTQAIDRARESLRDMTRPGPSTPQEEAETLKAHQTFLFTWDGGRIRQIFP